MLRRQGKPPRNQSLSTLDLTAAPPAAQSDPPEPRFPRPHVLLMDLDEGAECALRKAGFNVSVGSFGKPYATEQANAMAQVVWNGSINLDVSEQEVVVVDLGYAGQVPAPANAHPVPEGVPTWWCDCRSGLIDPRPPTMGSLVRMFDRILDHGGVFIIFARWRTQALYVYGHVDESRSLQPDGEMQVDNWSFLTALGPAHLGIRADAGRFIEVTHVWPALSRLLSRHVVGATWLCTFEPHERVKSRWLTLATNKFGGAVGGLIGFLRDEAKPEMGLKSLIIVLPDIVDKPSFLSELLTDVLPGAVAQLFPGVSELAWIRDPLYELPEVRGLQERIQGIQQEAARQVADLSEQVDAIRKETSYLDALLTQTGARLVGAVERTLRVLGFQNVVNMDEKYRAEGKDEALDEDLQIRDAGPLILVEVKGIGGCPDDSESREVGKYIARRMREEDRTDVHGLTIVNHQRAMPLPTRTTRPFRSMVVEAAEREHVGLMTTGELYRLTRSFLANGWSHGEIQGLFEATGRVDCVPSHYEQAGTVERYIPAGKKLPVNVVGVMVAGPGIRRGDRIAFESSVEFVEQDVTSLEINNAPVETARAGDLVGVETPFPRDKLRDGTRVFCVRRADA